MPQPDRKPRERTTISTPLPAGMAVRLVALGEEVGVPPDALVTLAVATLIGGWDAGDPAWRDGVYKLRDLVKQGKA